MGQTGLLYADTGLVIGAHGNVLITVLTEASTMERLRELRRHVEQFRRRWPGANCGLTVLTAGAIVIETRADVREESQAITRDNPSPGSSVVIEGRGFGAGAIRAFLSGIFLVTRARSTIHGSVAEGASWLAPIAATLGKSAVAAAELVEAERLTRAALRPSVSA